MIGRHLYIFNLHSDYSVACSRATNSIDIFCKISNRNCVFLIRIDFQLREMNNETLPINNENGGRIQFKCDRWRTL